MPAIDAWRDGRAGIVDINLGERSEGAGRKLASRSSSL
jgi:hypothetical protein